MMQWHAAADDVDLWEMQVHVLLVDVSESEIDWVQTSRHCEQVWNWLLSGRPALLWGLQRLQHIAAFRELATWFPMYSCGDFQWFGDVKDVPPRCPAGQ